MSADRAVAEQLEVLDPRYEELLGDYNHRGQVLARLVADYDRRNAKPWGRFLLWLLRKTT